MWRCVAEACWHGRSHCRDVGHTVVMLFTLLIFGQYKREYKNQGPTLKIMLYSVTGGQKLHKVTLGFEFFMFLQQ